MRNEDYLRESAKTESGQFNCNTVPADYYANLVRRVLSIGDELNDLKRELYYGLPNPNHFHPTTGQLRPKNMGRNSYSSSVSEEPSSGKAGDSGASGNSGSGDETGAIGSGNPSGGKSSGGKSSGGKSSGGEGIGTSDTSNDCGHSEAETSSSLDFIGPDPALLHAALGLLTEGCELLTAIHNDPVDKVNLREELGDIEWYLAILYRKLETSPEEIKEINIRKLRKRFGTAFSSEQAEVRDLAAERDLIEHGYKGSEG